MHLNYSHAFYYTEKQSGERYSTVPTGDIDFDRSLQKGHPIWKLPALTKKEKPKTLILTDWSLASMTEEDQKKYADVLLQMITDGFPIYIWQDGEMIKLTKYMLGSDNFGYFIKNITPVNSADVLQNRNKELKKLPPEQIHVLDRFEMLKLLHSEDKDQPSNNLPISLVSNSPFDTTEIIAMEEKAGSKVIILDRFPIKEPPKYGLGSYSISFKPKIINFNCNWTVSELGNSLLLYNIKLDELDLELITFKGDRDIYYEDTLIPRIIKIKHIKSLELNNLILMNKPTYKLDEKAHLNVDSIIISNSSVDYSFLINLTDSTNQLKKLKLVKNEFENDGEQINFLEMKHLEEFEFERESKYGGDEIIPSVLLNSPNLKKLCLHHVAITEEMINSIKSDKIETLDLTGCKIDYDLLIKLLLKTKNIKHFVIKDIAININSFEYKHDLNPVLENLESLTLPYWRNKFKDMLNYIKAPRCKKLKVNSLKNLGDKLKDIEELHFKFDYENRNIFNKYLSNSRSLKYLQLTIRFETLADIEDLNLPKLEHLHLISERLKDLVSVEKLKQKYPDLEISFEYKPTPEAEAKYKQDIKEEKQKPRDYKSYTRPKHDPEEYKNIKPTDPDNIVETRFTGWKKNTRNQGMIIERLTRYLRLTGKQLDLVPIIQDGICNALSNLYIDMKEDDWQTLLNHLLKWNGYDSSLTDDIKKVFDNIILYLKTHHNDVNDDKIFVGDNIANYLLACKKENKPFTLSNPYHVIGVRPPIDDQSKDWVIYDPNIFEGTMSVPENELITVLHEQLGNLFFSRTKKVELDIKDSFQFIETGGLLALCQATNADAILEKLNTKSLLSDKDKIKKALDGLWCRSTLGIPDWVRCIKHTDSRIQKLGFDLLTQYQTLWGETKFYKELDNSLNGVSPQKKSEYLDLLVRPTSTKQTDEKQSSVQSSSQLETKHVIKSDVNIFNKAAKEKLERLKRLAKLQSDAEKQFETWKSEKSEFKSLDDFISHIIKKPDANIRPGKKRLVKLNSTTEVNHLALKLQQSCQSSSRPLFYINSPDDLICAAQRIEKEKNTNRGSLKDGQGGALHQFLTDEYKSDTSPILLVIFEKFSKDDIVRFNNLLDTEGNIDGTKIPAHMMIIGLMNVNKPDSYQEADFLQRFNEELSCPSDIDLSKPIVTLPVVDTSSQQAELVPLYLSSNWKTRLLGGWNLDKNGWYFEEGLLAKALKKNSVIDIQSGPWDDPEFVRFWQEACLHKKIVHSGGEIKLPDNFKILKSHQYDWTKLSNQIATIEKAISYTPVAKVLNGGSFSSFFKLYDDCFIRQTGIIEAHKNKTLHVNVTHDLDEHAWAEILAECIKNQVTLKVHCAPFIKIPSALQSKIAITNTESKETKSTHTRIIQSTDPDVTITQILPLDEKEKEQWKVIDITECDISDLIKKYTIDKKFNVQTTESALLTALKNNQNVILKGKFSPTLASSLLPFLFERLTSEKTIKNKLILVSENCKEFQSLSVEPHKITKKEKAKCIELEFKEAKLDHMDLDNESLAQIKSRLHNPDFKDPWQGLLSLPSEIKLPSFDPSTSADAKKKFNEKRLQEVDKVLKNSPFVFLAGLTGVGKSTFVTDVYFKNIKNKYFGENDLSAWASNSEGGHLFIDEVNIGQKQWTEFEGLFNDPPTILINGKLHTLTDKHKVIFAGNPISYGDERQLSPLFARHGNAIVFDPLPPALIYEDMLKPIFDNTLLQKQAEKISKIILAVYQFLCEKSKDEVLISPRECEMIALLTLSHCLNNKSDPLDVARHYSYQLVKPLVPEYYQSEFDKQFKPNLELKTNDEKKASQSNFVITPSREQSAQQLHEWLALREWRCTKGQNDKQKYGGLGGFVLEGPPGTGKSELVIDTLRDRGYQELHLRNYTSVQLKDNQAYFLRMPVNLANNQKEKLLNWAFHNGVAVIVDEINSSPMMERLLNSLLMGKALDNKPPAKPGFMLIGTQNPVSMGGRLKSSTALSRRTYKVEVAEYPKQELTQILKRNGVEQEYAEVLVNAYQKKLDQAIKGNRKPPPTLRKLLEAAYPYMPRKIISNILGEVSPLLSVSMFSEKTVGKTKPGIIADNKSTANTSSSESNSVTGNVTNVVSQTKAKKK